MARRPRPARQEATPQRRAASPVAKAAPKASILNAAQSSSLVPRGVQTPAGYIAAGATNLGEIQPFKTSFFASLDEVRTREAKAAAKTPPAKDLARTRGYQQDDLMAIAEVAYHYLMNGGLRLAQTLYAGLSAISPEEAYFALGMGLTYDRMNRRQDAFTWYTRAQRLHPREPRAYLNQAELHLETRDFKKAQPLLTKAYKLAVARRDESISRKAAALLDHVRRQA